MRNAELTKGLSALNPLKDDRELLGQILKYNETNDASLLSSIKAHIRQEASLNYQDEALQMIEDVSVRDQMRLEMGLLDGGDVVCDFSQGQIKDGKNACSTICGQVISCLSNDESITSQQDMMELISAGIAMQSDPSQPRYSEDVMTDLDGPFDLVQFR